MAKYNAIKIERGSGGFGGPLIVKPEEGKAYYVVNEGLKNGSTGAVDL